MGEPLSRFLRQLNIALPMLLLPFLVAACADTGVRKANAPQFLASAPSTPTGISIYTPQPTPTLYPPNYKEADATLVAQNLQTWATSVALTAAPTESPGPPPEYPTPTIELGLLPGCVNASSYGPQCVNTWRGTIDGRIVQVDSGSEGADGDSSKGLILVHIWYDANDDIYYTPQQVGSVRIESVNGTQFSVIPVDPQYQVTFVFDLATRQWVNP
jgi:hypothetical protein